MTGESNVDDISNDIEDIIYNHLNGVIINLKRYLPNLSQMISPNIGNLVDNFDLIDNEDQTNFKKMHDIGMLNGHFCINAKTGKSHTECDASYTIISVPCQPNGTYKHLDPNFHFVINESCTLLLPLSPNIAFVFSGYMLTHQQLLKTVDRNKGIFINLASYGNKKLFDNMMKSFRRNM